MGGRVGMEYAFLLACAMNLFSYWFSDKMVLAMYRAKLVPETDDTGLVRTVRRLAHKANIPMPRVYIIDSEVPNAFATGRNPSHAAIAATTGIVDMLNEHELEGVSMGRRTFPCYSPGHSGIQHRRDFRRRDHDDQAVGLVWGRCLGADVTGKTAAAVSNFWWS